MRCVLVLLCAFWTTGVLCSLDKYLTLLLHVVQGENNGNNSHSSGGAKRDVIYDAGLGLAVEAMPEGVTVDSLWRVI